MIPFFGVGRQYRTLRDEILDVTDTVLSSGDVLDGKFTRMFESAIAERCDRKYAISVNSCTQGLILSLIATARKDANVLIPNISFTATVNSILMAGLSPIFCDTNYKGLIDLETANYDLSTRDIQTIMYPNLFGDIVDYDRFRIITEFFNHADFTIIEDAAQSFGAYYKGIPSGKLGTISVLSFDPTKNLNNYGSGGMILTDDLNLSVILNDLKNNGKVSKNVRPGTNSKMSETDCAQMMVKLKYFDKWQKRRTEIANYYIDQIQDCVQVLTANEGVQHAWSKFVIRLDNRHALRSVLNHAGIETKIHYETTLSELDVSFQFNDGQQLRESVAFTHESLSLPIYPELSDSEVEHIASSVKKYLS
jgi:hypothetical protein